MSEPTHLPTTIPTPPQRRRRERLAMAALTLAVIALLALGWQWLEQRQRIRNIEQALTQRLSEFSQSNQQSLALARQASANSAEQAARLALLDQRLEESRSQLEALQTLYLEVTNNRDAWAISDVEQLLMIAGQQLQLAGNVKSALIALQTADSRLQQIDKPQIIQLRKTLQGDIQRLQALPSIDVTGISLRLQTLVESVDQLPLRSERHPHGDSPQQPVWDTNPWRRLGQEVWLDLKRMVRIERIDRPEPPLLAPEQAYFLRENLKLRLLTARIALLQHDENSYRSDLQTAKTWISRHFDTRDGHTRLALQQLDQLSAGNIRIELPDIGASLSAISKYKLSLERARP